MSLPQLTDINFVSRPVTLRLDLDIPLENGTVKDKTRLETALPTLQALLPLASKVTVLGHLGRPEGHVSPQFDLEPVTQVLRQLVSSPDKLVFYPNTRFYPGEESNDPKFAQQLASLGEVFVNEAFAASHRHHASIVGIPRYLPSCLGLHFVKEITALDRVLHHPRRPLVLVMGGSKLETKLPLISRFVNLADYILVGGLLVEHLQVLPPGKAQVVVGRLTQDKQDIDSSTIDQFTSIIRTAGTIVWNGPLGVFEQPESSAGTRYLAQAINQAPGYKVIGGGDTEAAATQFNAEQNIDWISSGGGAMLAYLATGTLPGITAIEHSPRST